MEVVNALGIMTLHLGILRLDTLPDVFATNRDVEDKLQLERADYPRQRMSLARPF